MVPGILESLRTAIRALEATIQWYLSIAPSFYLRAVYHFIFPSYHLAIVPSCRNVSGDGVLKPTALHRDFCASCYHQCEPHPPNPNGILANPGFSETEDRH